MGPELDIFEVPQIENFMGPTWGPPGSCRPRMGPMVAPWTLLSGPICYRLSPAGRRVSAGTTIIKFGHGICLDSTLEQLAIHVKNTEYNHRKIVMTTHQVWGEYWTYEYEYWESSTRVVIEYNVFSIFTFIVLGKTSTRVVLTPALPHIQVIVNTKHDNWATVKQ